MSAPVTKSAKASCKGEILEIYRNIEDWTYRSNQCMSNVVAQLLRGPSCPNHLVANIVDENVAKYGSMSPSYLREGILVDPWGTPYNVSGYSSLTESLSRKSQMQFECEVFIWSSGPNRSNEYGRGDDVLWDEPVSIRPCPK